jgi:hypothetical protein
MIKRLAPALVPDGSDPEYAREMLNEGLLIAGFAPAGADPDDPLVSVIRKAGYDDQQFSGEDMERLREGFADLAAGILARKGKRVE